MIQYFAGFYTQKKVTRRGKIKTWIQVSWLRSFVPFSRTLASHYQQLDSHKCANAKKDWWKRRSLKRTSWWKLVIPITKRKSACRKSGTVVTYKGIILRVIAAFLSAPLGYQEAVNILQISDRKGFRHRTLHPNHQSNVKAKALKTLQDVQNLMKFAAFIFNWTEIW